MFKSIQSLFKNEYNQSNRIFALKRFFYWKVIRLLKLKNVSYQVWANKKININYDSFHCMWLMYNYIVDWEEFMLIQSILKEDDHVCDIGANMGLYTIWMSKFITSGQIHSFEPDDENFKRLSENVELNSLKNVSLNQNIVSEVDGELGFTLGLDGENHITTHKGRNVVNKKSVRLTTYLKEKGISQLKYVKIDTEGFELSVLKGAQQLIKDKKISIVQLEINKSLANANVNIVDLLNFLCENDYQLCSYNFHSNKLSPISYSAERENYFATYQLDDLNALL